MTSEKRTPYIWDYDITEENFRAILAGELTIGHLGEDWAALRLLENGTYVDIIHLLGYRRLIEGWPRWRDRLRSDRMKRCSL